MRTRTPPSGMPGGGASPCLDPASGSIVQVDDHHRPSGFLDAGDGEGVPVLLAEPGEGVELAAGQTREFRVILEPGGSGFSRTCLVRGRGDLAGSHTNFRLGAGAGWAPRAMGDLWPRVDATARAIGDMQVQAANLAALGME